MKTKQGKAIRLKNYTPPAYRITHVELDFMLDPEQTQVRSKLKIERQKETKQDEPLKLDGEDLKLVSVSLDGKKLEESDYRETEAGLTIRKLPPSKAFDLEIETIINPAANKQLSGLYLSGGNYCTQCEAEGFRRITYFLDRPDVLAVYTTRIEADEATNPVLLGNGNPVESGSCDDGRHYAIWHDPHPKPSYLFALVAGDLGHISQEFTTCSGKPVTLGIYVQKGKEERAHYAMDALVRSMQWDEQKFGREYDLDVFNIVAVPDFNMGAMENKGLNIFNDKYVLADPETATDADYANIERIIAHEYFHNWTGNRITCRDWFQLCLKEGLTVYRDQEFSSDERSRPVIRIGDVRGLKTAQFPEDSGPLSHPVRPESYREINNFYTATVYQKGAELVRMIATLLGEGNFRRGLEIYFDRHDGKAATVEQFLSCFEEAGNTDLSQFSLWYSQAGTPLLNIASKHDKKSGRLTLEVEQFTPATPGQAKKKPMVIPQAIGLVGPDGSDMKPASITGADMSGEIIIFDKRKHKLVFEGISERPVISLNRNFTAPIEVNYRHKDADLEFLSQHDVDLFGRWQAFQNLATRLIISATKQIRKGEKPEFNTGFLDIAENTLHAEELEPAFRATFLTLPSEADLAQTIGKNVDPDAISKAIKAMSVAMGNRFEDRRDTLLKQIDNVESFSPDAEQAGKRSLKNVLMHYAAIAGQKSALDNAKDMYDKANNMTDRANALRLVVHHHPDKELREAVLADFYDRFHTDHIVLDKWFTVQATRPGASTIKDVKRLMKHRDFSLDNPNRMRSLVAAFCMGNPTAFNQVSGAGYELVADTIIKLDGINPQVAARTLTGFRSWRQLEDKRRKTAEGALRKIAGHDDLSRDVSDILDRTLSKQD